MQHTATCIHETLVKLADAERAKICARFFKTGPGGYAEGDIFLGIQVPEIRRIAKEYKNLPFDELLTLLKSPLHEERRLALTIMSDRCKKKSFSSTDRHLLYTSYMDTIGYVNNWDLVDVSAPSIVGQYLIDKDKSILFRLARSENLWHRRIAIISTQFFIKQKLYEPTIQLATILLTDSQDLIHKAVGWMLRELGQQNPTLLQSFLESHISRMPRTMLRYAIEKFAEQERKEYLNKK